MNLYFIGTVLNLAGLYMIAGLGASISMNSGEFNLGGEGQIYTGGFVAAVILTSPWGSKLPAFIAVTIALIAAFLASALVARLSATLLYYKNADFLFTSFIVSSAIIPLIDGLIVGPFRYKEGNLLATPFLEDRFRFHGVTSISLLNGSFFVAIFLCLIFYYNFKHSSNGRKLCIYGISHQFAIYSGYNSKSIMYTAADASGGMHGICGAVAVCGTYFTCHSGFYMSMGWNSFSAALIAGGNPLLLIVSSLFMSFVVKISETISIFNNFGFDMSGIIQSAVLLTVALLRRPQNDS